MKEVIGQSENDIKAVINSIQEGTESTILNDKIAFIRDLLNEKLEQINYKVYSLLHTAKSTSVNRNRKITSSSNLSASSKTKSCVSRTTYLR